MSFGLGIGDFIKVLELAKGLRDRYKDAPDHLDSLSREIPSIHSVLEKIDDAKQRLTPPEVAALEAPIKECGKILAEIERIYDAGGGTKRLSDAAAEGPVEEPQAQQSRCSEPAVAGVVEYSAKISRLSGVKSIQCTATRQAVKEKRLLNDWRPQTISHSTEATWKAREDGTGQGLLDSEEFKCWTSERGKGLLCTGDPGSGKTIMTSIVIDELSRQFPEENSAIAYVFCNAKDQAKQIFYHILSSLAKQLVQASLPEKPRSLYKEHQKKATSRSENETIGLLHELVGAPARVFILIDTLDECSTDVRQRLLSQLTRLQCEAHAYIFATTRQIPEIADNPHLSRCDSLRIKASKDDVRRFVAGQIPQMKPFVQKRLDIQVKIKNVVSSKADGMFLLASLVMELLKCKQRPKDVLDTLDDLPTAYASYYDEAWERIKDQDPDKSDLARKHALAVEHESQIDEDSVFPEEAEVDYDGYEPLLCLAIQRKSEILSACNALLRMSEVLEAGKTGHSRPLPSCGVKIDKRGGPRITYPVMDAISCQHLTVLQKLLELKVDIEVRDSRGRTPLLCCVEEGGAEALKMLRRFGADFGVKDRGGTPALHLAVRRADVDTLRYLLNCDHAAAQAVPNGSTLDIEARDARGRTALWYSASCMTLDTLQMLLDHGANPEAKDNNGQTMLFTAAGTDRPEVVRHLLTQAALDRNIPDIEARDTKGNTALWHNASRGNLGMLQILLEYGADSETKNDAGQTILFAAAEAGRQEVVQYLLGVCGMDANAREDAGTMLLEVAVKALGAGMLTFGNWDTKREAEYLTIIDLFLKELKGDDVTTAHQAIMVQAVRVDIESNGSSHGTRAGS
ncbi:ankyrin repeat protein [Colletotrichum sojae]|uniref:Ankyrin repeat protein n=1 Tax=Colletotrichum sojae TaxID=2175907 RepID=A0A8H6INQ4_9PEZI|nr:ankyrin repeat protein [Colletotrichum sojae]